MEGNRFLSFILYAFCVIACCSAKAKPICNLTLVDAMLEWPNIDSGVLNPTTKAPLNSLAKTVENFNHAASLQRTSWNIIRNEWS